MMDPSRQHTFPKVITTSEIPAMSNALADRQSNLGNQLTVETKHFLYELYCRIMVFYSP
jgi:hypothetical protein